MILEGRRLTVRYPGAARDALSEVDVAVTAGSLVALAGPNGSGKTTLMRALLGTVPVAGGEALVDGRPVTAWSRPDLARVIGVVPQREEIWVSLTVQEFVLLGRYPRLGPLSPVSRADRAAVETALERCDVHDLADRRVDTLSGGEWQRVRIARALAQEPRVLVLDEPGTALDVRHEMEVMELARELVGEGIACLLISHHLNLAARYADRMTLLDQGRVVAAGPPGAVLTEPIVTRVFRWPLAVTDWLGAPQLVPLRPGEAPRRPSDR
jgi:iron complex transport system ATP-binding protein